MVMVVMVVMMMTLLLMMMTMIIAYIVEKQTHWRSLGHWNGRVFQLDFHILRSPTFTRPDEDLLAAAKLAPGDKEVWSGMVSMW